MLVAFQMITLWLGGRKYKPVSETNLSLWCIVKVIYGYEKNNQVRLHSIVIGCKPF